MKNKILLLLLLITYQAKTNCVTGYFKDLATKIVLIYVSNYSTTLVHELGHALIYKMRGIEPKVAVGGITEDVDFESLNGLVNFVGLNPDQGATFTEKPFVDYVDFFKNIILNASGAAFGISFRLMQLALLEKFKDSFSPSVFRGLRDFMIGKNIQEAIYGFTPFDQAWGGDGAEVFSQLHTKYSLKTDFFHDARFSYDDVFIKIKNNFIKFYVGYNFFYYFLKYFETTGYAKSINKVMMNSKVYTSAVAYAKEKNAVSVAKLMTNGKTDEFQPFKWYYKLLLEGLIY